MSSQYTSAISSDYSLSLYNRNALVQAQYDITQCIDIILNTQPGSDPFRPLFGTRYIDHLDTPVNVCAPNMVNEIVTAIERWEQRVKITSVTWKVDGSRVLYQIDWTSKYGRGVNILPL